MRFFTSIKITGGPAMLHMFLSFSVVSFAECTDQAQVSLQLTVFLMHCKDFSPVHPSWWARTAYGGHGRLRENVVLGSLKYRTHRPRQYATM